MDKRVAEPKRPASWREVYESMLPPVEPGPPAPKGYVAPPLASGYVPDEADYRSRVLEMLPKDKRAAIEAEEKASAAKGGGSGPFAFLEGALARARELPFGAPL